jgi:tetratricopeptide (TPR) repeat protein
MLKYLYKLLFLSTLLICVWLSQPALSQQVPPAQQVQQGIEQYQQQNYQAAIATWTQALEQYQSTQDLPNTAIVLENLARGSQTIGQNGDAIAYWEKAITLYRQIQKPQQLNRALTEQAQTYSRLGQHRQAITLLCGREREVDNCVSESALAIARTHSDTVGQIAALGSLGEAYRSRGEYDIAIDALKQALAIAQTRQDEHYQSMVLSNLGKAYADRAQVSYHRAILAQQIEETENSERFKKDGLSYDQKASRYFQQSLALPSTVQNPALYLHVLMDAIPSVSRTGNSAAAQTQQSLLGNAIALLDQLPDSQEKVYTAIDLVGLLQPISSEQTFSRLQCLADQPQAQVLLEKALSIAQHTGDRRSQSFALGELGHFYECQKNYAKATDLTQQARTMAEQEPDSLYLWEWQSGRILKAQDQPSSVIIPVYERAIATLETIRNDILTAKRDLQFDFRDTIKPLYQDLIEMRLATGKTGVILPV